MNKKILLTLLAITTFLMFVCSYSFAATNSGNMLMNAGNSVGNVVTGVANTVVDGARNLGNDAAKLGTDTMNTVDNATGMSDNNNDNYTATRTAATNNNNLFGMSDTAWTWLILGVVGAIIVGLVWYYGAQYEHRNYTND